MNVCFYINNVLEDMMRIKNLSTLGSRMYRQAPSACRKLPESRARPADLYKSVQGRGDTKTSASLLPRAAAMTAGFAAFVAWPKRQQGPALAEQARVLGRGGHATVYLGTRDGRPFAVKQTSYAEGIPEVNALKRLEGQPGIVHMHGHHVDPQQDRIEIFLEPACGNLEQLHPNGLGEEGSKKVFLQLLRGVKSLHDSGIVHNDLSPANCLCVRRANADEWVLADFGQARHIDAKADDKSSSPSPLPQEPLPGGTPGYHGPERLSSKANDIFALGACLDFLINGSPDTSDELSPPEMSAACCSLIGRMVQEEPAKRPTVDEIYADPWVKQALLAQHKSSGSPQTGLMLT